jgi:XTP/dITP diphosphohydrolase
MSVRMVLASKNRHKAEELTRLLPGFAVEPYPGELPPETGETFRENALIKARHVHGALGGGVWVLADDSGIAAAALGGAPGVRSARFAGEAATDAANLQKLLDALAGADDRRVAYVAELVAIAPDGRELHARGELAGTLARAPRGSGGFGYDPAFVPEGETRTVAEMAPAEKDAISHRGRAAGALRDVLAAHV